jgi:hypothetical protein
LDSALRQNLIFLFRRCAELGCAAKKGWQESVAVSQIDTPQFLDLRRHAFGGILQNSSGCVHVDLELFPGILAGAFQSGETRTCLLLLGLKMFVVFLILNFALSLHLSGFGF